MKSIVLSTLMAVCLPAGAVLSVGSEAYTYSQDFNSLSSSGTSTWSNNSTLAGWYLYKSDLTATTVLNGGTGSGNAGGFWSFGTAANERALGGLGSNNIAAFGDTDPGVATVGPPAGTTAGYIAIGLSNDTGTELTEITFGFSGEQWRNGGVTATQTMTLQYGVGTTFASVVTWTAPGGAFDWTSPVTSATSAAVNGNTAGLVSGLGGSLNELSWGSGQTLWIRWLEVNDTGNDHGLAIDNFSITEVVAVPEPATALLGSLALLGILRRRR